MQLFFRIITFISLSVWTLSAVDLDWEHDYEKALVQAKHENKDVYVFIGADVCKFCDRFKSTTLQDKAVMQTLRKNYVLVYLSRDRHKVPRQFGTAGVPKHYFVTAEGKIFYYTWGSRDVDGFYIELDEADLRR